VLIPVYDALGLDWDPRTAGSVEDELGPTPFERVTAAIRTELAGAVDLDDAALDPETIGLAERLEPEHAV
jgi:hypothetical protein